MADFNERWSLDVQPVYSEDADFMSGWTRPALEELRVAIKRGSTEVLTFHCVRSFSEAGKIISYTQLTEESSVQRLIEDAELGRQIRKVSWELFSG